MSTTLPSIADEMVEDVLAQLPGVTPDFITRELAATARDALPTARTWVHDFFLDVHADQGLYDLDPGFAGARVTTLLAVSYGCSRPLMPARSAFPMHCSGTPTHFWTPQPGTLLLHPTPNGSAESHLGVRAVLTPTRGIEVVPETVLEGMRDLLVLGAIARLQNMPAKPFSGTALAARNFRLYRSRLMRMKAEQDRALHAYGGRSWSFPGIGTRRRGGVGLPNGGCCGDENTPVVPALPRLRVSDAVLTTIIVPDPDPDPQPGTGPQLSLAADSLVFDVLANASQVRTLRIRNTGDEPLVISNIAVVT